MGHLGPRVIVLEPKESWDYQGTLALSGSAGNGGNLNLVGAAQGDKAEAGVPKAMEKPPLISEPEDIVKAGVALWPFLWWPSPMPL